MREFLNDAHYGYILPVFNKKDGDYEIRISKGAPLREGANLTEEGKEYVRKREGRWCVPAVDSQIKQGERKGCCISGCNLGIS